MFFQYTIGCLGESAEEHTQSAGKFRRVLGGRAGGGEGGGAAVD